MEPKNVIYFKKAEVEAWFKLIKANAKIRIPKEDELKATIDKLFTYVAFINSLPEDTEVINGVEIGKWPMCKYFAPYVQRRSTRYNPNDLRGRDQRVRISMVENGKIQILLCPFASPYDVRLLIDDLARYLRKDGSELTVYLDSLWSDASLADVISVIGYIDEKGDIIVRYDDAPFIPQIINKDTALALFKESYFNFKYQDMHADYMLRVTL